MISKQCKEVKQVWRELSLEEIRCDLENACSAREMMEKICKLEAQQQAQVVTLLWLWWKERNKWREEGRRRASRDVAYMVAARADKLNKPKQPSLLSDFGQTRSWSRPRLGVLKINSD